MRGARIQEPAPGSPLTLLCLPCAGGGASSYARWQDRLSAHGAHVRVRPVQLPGREERAHEPRFTDLDAQVMALESELGDELSRPHILLGHSMGAFVVHALALRRQQQGASLPRALVLLSHRAPHIPPNGILVPDADDETLAERLAELGGIPWELARRKRFRARLMPLVRDDLRLCSSTTPEAAIEPLDMPLHLFIGRQDHLVPVGAMAAWSRHGGAGSELRTMPGGHFFVRTHESDLLSELAAVLRRYTGERSASAHESARADLKQPLDEAVLGGAE
ncbi:alpha/beta fold hydrolase [Streptomyces sp. NPDC086554]|uniref:thioesterase II family protein n=1 Tax=Streptomyces sp. NPDC086554 TaxID=3154864 RepID=UPI003427F9FD